MGIFEILTFEILILTTTNEVVSFEQLGPDQPLYKVPTPSNATLIPSTHTNTHKWNTKPSILLTCFLVN